MPPKIDVTQIKYLRVKVFGGEAGPASTLAPKLGPLGLNAKKIGDDIIKISSAAKGIRQMIQLKVQNRNAEITVIPTASALLIKELNEPPRDRKKTKNIKHNGNLTLQQVIKVAKMMQEKSMAKTFTGTVTQMLGTCNSIGCTVDGKSPKDVIKSIKAGELKVE